MIHLIALLKLSNDKYVYHFSSQYKDSIINKKNELLTKSSPKDLSLYNIHVLMNQDKEFSSIQAMDPYFKEVTLIKNIDEFFDLVNNKSYLDDSDIASFLLRKFNLKPFALQKVIYYIYSDFLEIFGKSPFNARFWAFDKGPVDEDIYRDDKYNKENLIKNINFEQKIINNKHKKDILSLIDIVVKKYGNYYNDVWKNKYYESPEFNLTHRNNTPWSAARKRAGRNAIIMNKDIKALHCNEKLN